MNPKFVGLRPAALETPDLRSIEYLMRNGGRLPSAVESDRVGAGLTESLRRANDMTAAQSASQPTEILHHSSLPAFRPVEIREKVAKAVAAHFDYLERTGRNTF